MLAFATCAHVMVHVNINTGTRQVWWFTWNCALT